MQLWMLKKNLNRFFFCKKMIKAVRDWLPTVQNLTIFQQNYKSLFKRYPDLPGFCNVPVPYIG